MRNEDDVGEAMMIVSRKIIRSVLCSRRAYLCATIVHSAMHTHEQTDLTVVCRLALAFLC